MAIYGPYMAIYGPYMAIYGPYMVHIWPIYGHLWAIMSFIRFSHFKSGHASDPCKYGSLLQVADQMFNVGQFIAEGQAKLKVDFLAVCLAVGAVLAGLAVKGTVTIEAAIQLALLSVVAAATVCISLFLFELKVLSSFNSAVSSHLRYALCSAEGNVQKTLCRVAEKCGYVEKRVMRAFWDTSEIARCIAVECDWSWHKNSSWEVAANAILAIRNSVRVARDRWGQTESQIKADFLEAVEKGLEWQFKQIQAQVAKQHLTVIWPYSYSH